MNYNDAITEQESSLNIYDEAAQTAERAFRAFRALYEVQNPPPKESPYPTAPIADAKPSAEDKPIEATFWGTKQWGMIAGLVGSVIVSASHTIPVFLGLTSISEINLASIEFIIGLAIFVMIEMSVIVFAYSATESEGNSDTAHRVKSFTRGGMWFIVTIAILANVYYVLAANITIPSDGIIAISWQWIRVTIFLLIGTSAPVIAFMTGDILAVDILKHRAKTRHNLDAWNKKLESDLEAWRMKVAHEQATWEAKCEKIKATHEVRIAQWNEGLKQSWASNKSKWNGAVNIQVAKPEIPVLPLSIQTEQTDRQSGMGYARLSNATDKAYQYLVDNPDIQNKTVRELAEVIGVGKDSVSKAKKRLFDEGTVQ